MMPLFRGTPLRRFSWRSSSPVFASRGFAFYALIILDDAHKAPAVVLGLCYFPVVGYDTAPAGSGGGCVVLGFVVLGCAIWLVVVLIVRVRGSQLIQEVSLRFAAGITQFFLRGVNCPARYVPNDWKGSNLNQEAFGLVAMGRSTSLVH